MADFEINTLADCVDLYLAQRQISKKKYYASYLINAKYVWRYLFKNTIYAVNSQWFTLQKGTPYNYINIPKDNSRIFSVCKTDRHNRIEELFYDNLTNIIAIPTSSQKKCGCTCDCGGLCDDVNSLTYTTRVIFTVNGTDYVEKTWVKVCPNGDVIEYKITPTKKYNNFTGDAGDYFIDYNNDYDIGNPPFSDYTIVYTEFQKIICKLSVKECGCPEDTPENIDLLTTHCGYYLPVNACCKKQHKQEFLNEINTCKGRVKMSECGTKIYYIPDKSYEITPEFLLLNWQTSGENCSDVVQVPEYANEAMFFGIDWYSKRFNNSYNKTEKDDAKYAWNNAQNELIMYLNPLNFELLGNIQDAKILY